MDFSTLTPEQQQSFLSLLGQQNQQSMDPTGYNRNPAPPVPQIQQQAGDQIHPMDAMSQIAQKMGLGTAQPQSVGLRLPMQGGPNFLQRLGSVMLGHPVDQYTAPIAATNQAPTPNTYGIPQPSPIAPGMYSMESMQKYHEDQAKVAQNQSLYGVKNPIPPPAVAALLAKGDISGAQAMATAMGIPFANQWMSMGATVKGANAREQGASAQSSRAETYNNQYWTGLGEQLSGLKGNGDFQQQNARISAVTHGWQVLEQGYDTNSGTFKNISPTFAYDLAIAAAKATVGTQQLTNEMISGIKQRTAKGDLAGGLAYATNDPTFIGAAPDKVIDMYGSMLVRQGLQAQQLRDRYLQGAIGSYASGRAANPTKFNQTVTNTLGTAPDFARQLTSSPIASRYTQDIQRMNVPETTQAVSPTPTRTSPLTTGNSPAKADPGTRYNQLRKSGLSKAQAYSLMHQEGY